MLIRRLCRAALLLALVSLVPGGLSAQNDERPQRVIRQLSFEGNKSINDYTLRRSIATTQSSAIARWGLTRWIGLGNKTHLDQTEFHRDVLRIRALYRLSGFPDVTVDTLVRRSNGDVFIRFEIDEGEPVLVTALRVAGLGDIVEVEDVYQAMPLRVGDPFSRLLFQASVDTIRARLADRGHPYAEVFRNFDERRDTRTALITFEVDPGPRVTVDSVEVSGTDNVSEKVVRNTVRLRVGQTYSWSEQYRSQLDLYRTGMFNYANVSLADMALTDPSDSGVTIRAQVAEGPLHRFQFGAGYGTVDCFRGLTSWTAHNFTGGGRRLDLFAGFSKIGAGDPLNLNQSVCPALGTEPPERLALNYNLTAGITQPFLFSRRASATLSLFAQRRSEIQAYVRRAVGGEFSWAYRLAWRTTITPSYSLAWGQTVADDVTYCTNLNVCTEEDIEVFKQPQFRGVITLAFLREHRIPLVDPARGSRLSAEVRFSGPIVGSDTLTQFLKGVVEYASHHQLGRRDVVGWRVKWGAIVAPERGLEGQDLRFVPVEERFYAGGPNTVRGYSFNELGPIVRVVPAVEQGGIVTVDTARLRTSASGGNDILLANVEWRHRLSRSFTAAVFVDAGHVIARDSLYLTLSKLRITPGVGIRMASPLGPIRLDVGFNPYGPETAPLYADLEIKDSAGDTIERALVLLTEDFTPEQGFWDRFRINISIGQAF